MLAALLAAGSLAACNSSSAPSDAASQSEEKAIHIVTTIFPEYDWVKSILGDNPAGAEITMLLDNGVDLHSYQPTAEDILKISGCDLFIYVGGESDEWVEDALAQAENKDMKVINLLETLGDNIKEEELVEGDALVGLQCLAHQGVTHAPLLCGIANRACGTHDLLLCDFHRLLEGRAAERCREQDRAQAQGLGEEADGLEAVAIGDLEVL